MGVAVNWGFIGASQWAGRYLIPAVQAVEDANAVGVFSSSPERGGRFAEESGLERSYASLEEMLADPGIDAVYIGTTNDLHASARSRLRGPASTSSARSRWR